MTQTLRACRGQEAFRGRANRQCFVWRSRLLKRDVENSTPHYLDMFFCIFRIKASKNVKNTFVAKLKYSSAQNNAQKGAFENWTALLS